MKDFFTRFSNQVILFEICGFKNCKIESVYIGGTLCTNFIFQEEASILWQMRNVSEVVQLWGLYEGPNQSVLVTDDLIGGDLAERLCRPDFELNEGKCRRYIQQVCRQVQI